LTILGRIVMQQRAIQMLGAGASKKNKGAATLPVTKGGISPQLWKRVPELGGSSAFLLYLSQQGSDRLTLTQAAFFLLAATADAAGRPSTRTELFATHNITRGSIKNSYRQLLEPSRMYPNALGWLTTETNPNDDRESFLRLTAEGKAVIVGALAALEPLMARDAPALN
jgi:DNA-binding MarR family transcriptional regulator